MSHSPSRPHWTVVRVGLATALVTAGLAPAQIVEDAKITLDNYAAAGTAGLTALVTDVVVGPFANGIDSDAFILHGSDVIYAAQPSRFEAYAELSKADHNSISANFDVDAMALLPNYDGENRSALLTVDSIGLRKSTFNRVRTPNSHLFDVANLGGTSAWADVQKLVVGGLDGGHHAVYGLTGTSTVRKGTWTPGAGSVQGSFTDGTPLVFAAGGAVIDLVVGELRSTAGEEIAVYQVDAQDHWLRVGTDTVLAAQASLANGEDCLSADYFGNLVISEGATALDDRLLAQVLHTGGFWVRGYGYEDDLDGTSHTSLNAGTTPLWNLHAGNFRGGATDELEDLTASTGFSEHVLLAQRTGSGFTYDPNGMIFDSGIGYDANGVVPPVLGGGDLDADGDDDAAIAVHSLGSLEMYLNSGRARLDYSPDFTNADVIDVNGTTVTVTFDVELHDPGAFTVAPDTLVVELYSWTWDPVELKGVVGSTPVKTVAQPYDPDGTPLQKRVEFTIPYESRPIGDDINGYTQTLLGSFRFTNDAQDIVYPAVSGIYGSHSQFSQWEESIEATQEHAASQDPGIGPTLGGGFVPQTRIRRLPVPEIPQGIDEVAKQTPPTGS